MKLRGWLRLARLTTAGAFLFGLTFLSTPAQAQNDYQTYRNPTLAGTRAEEEALTSLETYKLVKLREQARAILKENPNSFAGRFLMGYSLHNSEGDLPRAKYQLNIAKELFIKKYTSSPPLDAPWGWYEKILLELVQVNAEMDNYDEQIAQLDDYLKLCRQIMGQDPPNVLAAYAWPLMKLGREKDARAKLAQASSNEDESTQTTYLNTLGALEMEFGHPNASYAAFKELVEGTRTRGWSKI